MGTINEKLDRFKEDAHALEHEMEQYEDDMPYLLTKMRDLLTNIQDLLTEIEVSEMEDDNVNVRIHACDLNLTAAQFKKVHDRVTQNLNGDNSDFHMVDGKEIADIFDCNCEFDLWWFFETFNGDPIKMWKKYVGRGKDRW